MFARTERLLLRPGWIEDAPALAAALGHPLLGGSATTAAAMDVPADAAAFLTQPVSPTRPRLLAFARAPGGPVLVGGVGLRDVAGTVAFGYWIHPDHWGRGYATEAGRALVGIADMLGVHLLTAACRIDSPASGVVLQALGFRRGTSPALVRRHAATADPAVCPMIRTLRTDVKCRPLAA